MTESNADAPARSLCRFHLPGTGARLGGVFAGGVVDLTTREPVLCATLWQLMAAPTGTFVEVLERHAHVAPDYHFDELDRAPAPDAPHLLPPIDRQEVWAAGVTYTRSREARMEESDASADVYGRVYDAERPELFFKATPERVSGPNATVAVRADSAWSVPEPELTLLVNSSLQIVGYTVGDDLTARDIEGQNPLYLPQAKMFDRCAALGPVVVPADWVDPYQLDIRCEIRRGVETIFAASTSTGQLHRRLEHLVAYLGRHNSFPAGAYLMTGTGIVPPDDVALGSGDAILISIVGIGTLRNRVA